MSYNIKSATARECVESARSYFKGSDLDRRQGKYMAAQSADLQREGEALCSAARSDPFFFSFLFFIIVLGTEQRKQVYSSLACKRNDSCFLFKVTLDDAPNEPVKIRLTEFAGLKLSLNLSFKISR